MAPETENLYAQLRRLVLQDPSRAARVFLEALQGNDPELDSMLAGISRPSEGRLRQLVANAVRNHHDKERIASYLHSWRATEADEFTRRALNAALSDVDASQVSPIVGSHPRLPAPAFLENYRYISDRLKHRILNTVLGAQGVLLGLRGRIDSIPSAAADQDVQQRIAKLTNAISVIGRAVGAIDVDPAHFALRKIELPAWLQQMNKRYSAQYSPIILKIDCPVGVHSIIEASDYLLETIFWNLWTNAQQSAPECEITLQFRQSADSIEVLPIDNGPGLSAQSKGLAFTQQFSQNSPHRGRGLLEVADAVDQLHGSVDIVECAKRLRVRLTLPLSPK